MGNQKKKILIIDDDPDIVEILSEKLRSSGFETSPAFDGEEGLAMALKNKPDFIILDILMPKMDGLEVLKSIRDDSWGKSVPIMILTNTNDNEKFTKALEIGVDDYKVKTDVNLADIVVNVKKILGCPDKDRT